VIDSFTPGFLSTMNESEIKIHGNIFFKLKNIHVNLKGSGYSWEWIGHNPNPIGFWHLDFIGFGSSCIWTFICVGCDRIGLCWIKSIG
jgi:hypothetical protein